MTRKNDPNHHPQCISQSTETASPCDCKVVRTSKSRFILLKRENTGDSIKIPYEPGWDEKTVEAVCAAIDRQLVDDREFVLGVKLEIFTVDDMRNPAYDMLGVFDDYTGPNPNDFKCHSGDESICEPCQFGVGECSHVKAAKEASTEDDEVFAPEEIDWPSGKCTGCDEISCICYIRD